MTEDRSWIDDLRIAADSAAAAEAQFRREAAARIVALECERVLAFRRLNLMRAVTNAIASAENEEAAISTGLATLRARLDWTGEDGAREAVLSHFVPVVQSVFVSHGLAEHSRPSAGAMALAEFETWYAATHGASFWVLFEEYMAETPRVDF